jgi:hypothetical protein
MTPSATLAVHCGNGASFRPYQNTHLSRYDTGFRAWGQT